MADVSSTLLAEHGAVSGAIAAALAEGIRARTGASVGIATTGLAGPATLPEGPDAGKPVGLVYVAVAGLGQQTEVRELKLTGDRERIRLWTTQHALELVRRLLL